METGYTGLTTAKNVAENTLRNYLNRFQTTLIQSYWTVDTVKIRGDEEMTSRRLRAGHLTPQFTEVISASDSATFGICLCWPFVLVIACQASSVLLPTSARYSPVRRA
jgi:hypothetical protein